MAKGGKRLDPDPPDDAQWRALADKLLAELRRVAGALDRLERRVAAELERRRSRRK